MAATKSVSTIIAAATSNAAAGNTYGTSLNLTTAYGALLTVRLTNGATGPTIAAAATILVSGNGSSYYTFYKVAGDTVGLSSYDYAIDIPPATMYVTVNVGGNTGQAITCEAFAQVLLTI